MTSPGHGDGPGWRARVGLAGDSPMSLITTLGVFRFDPDTREAVASFHPDRLEGKPKQAQDVNIKRRTVWKEATPPQSPRTP